MSENDKPITIRSGDSFDAISIPEVPRSVEIRVAWGQLIRKERDSASTVPRSPSISSIFNSPPEETKRVAADLHPLQSPNTHVARRCLGTQPQTALGCVDRPQPRLQTLPKASVLFIRMSRQTRQLRQLPKCSLAFWHNPNSKVVYHVSDGKSIVVLTRMKPVFHILHDL